MKTAFFLVLIALLVGCAGNQQESTTQNDRLELIPEPDKDLREKYEQEQQEAALKDTVYGIPEQKELQPIIDHYQGVNAIKVWTTVEKRALNLSAEGGEATYYLKGAHLEKIWALHFGETHRTVQEVYLEGESLSVVLEKRYEYNRPITWDSTAMVESWDTESFDDDKTELIETRSYFKDGALIWQEGDEDRTAPFTAKRLRKEQKRLETHFEQLKELL